MKKSDKIIGFHSGHDCSYAILDNGIPVLHNELERFTREKWTTKFPINSANWCLKKGNIKWEDLNKIVVRGQIQKLCRPQRWNA